MQDEEDDVLQMVVLVTVLMSVTVVGVMVAVITSVTVVLEIDGELEVEVLQEVYVEALMVEVDIDLLLVLEQDLVDLLGLLEYELAEEHVVGEVYALEDVVLMELLLVVVGIIIDDVELEVVDAMEELVEEQP